MSCLIVFKSWFAAKVSINFTFLSIFPSCEWILVRLSNNNSRVSLRHFRTQWRSHSRAAKRAATQYPVAFFINAYMLYDKGVLTSQSVLQQDRCWGSMFCVLKRRPAVTTGDNSWGTHGAPRISVWDVLRLGDVNRKNFLKLGLSKDYHD